MSFRQARRERAPCNWSANGPANKEPVVTLVERDGHARSFHVASVMSKRLRPIMFQNADRKSHLMTDGAQLYIKIGEQYAAHDRLDHSKE